jgi:antitoxin component of MazEF toxin-antitoxin module
MTERLDVIAVGDRLAVLLPADLAARIGATVGGQVEAEADAGGVHLRSGDPEYDRQVAIGRAIMQKDANILAALAR